MRFSDNGVNSAFCLVSVVNLSLACCCSNLHVPRSFRNVGDGVGPDAETRRGKSGIRRRAARQNAPGPNLQKTLGAAPNERKLEDELWERHCETVQRLSR